MPTDRNIRIGTFGTVWVTMIPVLLVLSSLVIAQNVSPELLGPVARQSSISAGSIHCQTKRFDSDAVQWIAPVGVFGFLPSGWGANWALTRQLLPAIQTKGFHFNRPPPTS